MRKIEAAMLQAIKAGKSWNLANTQVTVSSGLVCVYLHGHAIAERTPAGQWRVSLAGWNTVTTRRVCPESSAPFTLPRGPLALA